MRGLVVEARIPDEGVNAFFPISGAYSSALHMDRAQFDSIDGEQAVQKRPGASGQRRQRPHAEGCRTVRSSSTERGVAEGEGGEREQVGRTPIAA